MLTKIRCNSLAEDALRTNSGVLLETISNCPELYHDEQARQNVGINLLKEKIDLMRILRQE
jgi:hypothetical protein